jgi:hypothetical protein
MLALRAVAIRPLETGLEQDLFADNDLFAFVSRAGSGGLFARATSTIRERNGS